MSVMATSIGKKAVRIANSIVNLIVLTVILLLATFGCYALWDSDQVYQMADVARYEGYKPRIEDEWKSFGELQALNPEVFAWLTVYGTHIDYPVTQGDDNMKYVNTNAEGDHSLSGSIFLDCDNSKDFSDFNSILFGHHMEKHAMFGEIGLFTDQSYFDVRLYGNLYYGGKDHGLEFFAFIHTNAYDSSVFTPGVSGKEVQQVYLNNLLIKAKYSRDIGVTVEDQIVLLSTCSTESTNGRDILVARITDNTYGDAFESTETNNTDNTELQPTADKQSDKWPGFLTWSWMALLLLAALVILVIIIYHNCESVRR